jgi:PadR family transcriptional regulator, regulatory protein PadR
MMDPLFRDLTLGFIKVHILYHAGIEPVYGAWLQEELTRHGYEIGPGTLYPTLHALEEAGYLLVEERVVEGRVRKYYALTEAGAAALHAVREKALELVREIWEGVG